MNRIITISRQFGSGGRTIGKKVGEILDIPCYDNEIIEELAKDSAFTKDYIAEHGEYTTFGNIFLNSWMNSSSPYVSDQDIIYRSQRKIILDIAEKGPCIIIGRCADFILKDKANLLKVFIHASYEKRADRIVKVYGEKEEPPIKRLKDKDKRRAGYYNFYTDIKWGKVENYDLCLNSGVLGLDKCAEIISECY